MTRLLAVRIVSALGLVAALGAPANAQIDGFDPMEVRAQARDAGLDSLREMKVPQPPDLAEYLRSGSEARRAAIQLGKALFWDMQVGSDGQACASCHFHAGADPRAKNQLSPGLTDTTFDPLASGGGGPNYELTAADFPFHRLEDQGDRTSVVLHDTDDVCSSQGVFSATFRGLERGESSERGRSTPDPIFTLGGVNVRRVEPRNTPSVINAVFNRFNFWDGRAHHTFNGVSSLGPLDAGATILVNESGRLVRRTIRIDNASLASQAVEPPGSDLEMAFAGRSFPVLARKLLALRPLGDQLVHPKDSVLGSLARTRLERGRVVGKPGLTVTYADLIKRAFERRYWDSGGKIDGHSQMEHNLSLFFGLAVQLYESTLVSDETPFDDFMAGADHELTQEQLEGLLVFIKTQAEEDFIFARIGQGNCVACHAGPALTSAAAHRAPGHGHGGEEGTPEDHEHPEEEVPPIVIDQTSLLIADVLLVLGPRTAFLDTGFSNLGVRPSAEDPGRGGTALGLPLSFVRQRLAGLPFAPELPACGGMEAPACPEEARVAVDGAFKVPGLRNVELTGPYFHNGGQATLRQTVLFYERLGDFSNENFRDLDPHLVRVDIVEKDEKPLVAFMRSLTDERVRWEREPFDHPQLLVPNGHPGDHATLDCVRKAQACDHLLETPAVGAGGRRAARLSPLEPFLGLDPLAK